MPVGQRICISRSCLDVWSFVHFCKKEWFISAWSPYAECVLRVDGQADALLYTDPPPPLPLHPKDPRRSSASDPAS